jgi:glycosyltransferase involved in cell wall biosynthesis
MHVLYISYDGMTDPLGASQVMPYLCGLAKEGHRISLMSFEKNARFENGKSGVEKTLQPYGIEWFPLPYTATPPVLSTMKDVRKAFSAAESIIRTHPVDAVHCRSYIAALAGRKLQRKYKLPFIFDMRGFYADERVDGGLWNRSNPLFDAVYRYFKRKERVFLAHADHVISLTEAGKEEMLRWNVKGLNAEKISVIPCCADTDLFRPPDSEELLGDWRCRLNIYQGQTVISYLGSLGTWYLVEEMFDFFKIILELLPNAIFLIISGDDPEKVMQIATRKDIPPASVKIVAARRHEVPQLLALSTANLFFIQPYFSKMASSPTKMGEALSTGVPVICNDGVGDCSRLLEGSPAGLIIPELSEECYRRMAPLVRPLGKTDRKLVRQLALDKLSLTEGLRRYQHIYSLIEQQRQP